MPPRIAPKSVFRTWFAVEAIPIYVAVGGACLGASWYLYRLATGPTVVWTKNNPHPYLNIEQNQGTKLYEINQKFEKRCVRSCLRVGGRELMVAPCFACSWKRDKL
ncbi:hypothetical protein HMN09_00508500 [Mycena chlorophos]|uniref:Uncharacterized protein n=1 Tax=Mycena chlorophos TaxID=658473 RepID=A0A8H6TCX9_MYCCL|nr:hypothetical protein HMN09_00508500 [Mycena chlorophos]